jgi:hypothetical protein
MIRITAQLAVMLRILFGKDELDWRIWLNECKRNRNEILLPGIDMKLVWGRNGWILKTYSHSYAIHPELAMADLYSLLIKAQFPTSELNFKTAIIPIYPNCKAVA